MNAVGLIAISGPEWISSAHCGVEGKPSRQQSTPSRLEEAPVRASPVFEVSTRPHFEALQSGKMVIIKHKFGFSGVYSHRVATASP